MSTTELLKLQTWLSPAFPVGSFSYSHGLEYAVEQGLVTDWENLASWLAADLRHGSGWCDAVVFAQAWRDPSEELLILAKALPATAELALETEAQGAAFLTAARAAWPVHLPFATAPYPFAVAVVCAHHEMTLATCLPAYLLAWAANLVSAGVRLVPLGQSDGLRAVAALEPVAAEVAALAVEAPLADLGSAAVMVDWASANHETQYTRLFRS
ncbi:MAG: urease accessory UreF family protein [Alphaproteobacteria bacterium]